VKNGRHLSAIGRFRLFSRSGRHGIKERGQIKTGYHADMVVFNENPDLTPTGIEAVIINGKVVF
jgi:imidazolonepropionase-like amidohydrolase